MTKNIYRFENYATRGALFELEAEPGITVGALKALVEQHLSDGDSLCPMRYFDRWHCKCQVGGHTRIKCIAERDNGLTLSEAFPAESVMYLEGPVFTEEQELSQPHGVTQTEVDTLILKHGNRPMKALYEALKDEDIEIPMAIVMDQRCGIERATEWADELKIRSTIFSMLGATPLMMALHAGRVDVAKALMGAGANIAAADRGGQTPLHIAAGHGDVEAIEALVKLGANLEATDDSRKTPLHSAVENEKVEAIEALGKLGANLEAPEHEGLLPLHIAALNGQVQVIEALGKLGANVEAAEDIGRSPLHYAALYGEVEAIEALVKLGANLEAADNNRQTPLHLGVEHGEVAAIKALVKLGANLEATDAKGRTPQNYTVEYGKVEAIETCNAGPLHVAALNGKVAAIEALVKLGAKLEATDN